VKELFDVVADKIANRPGGYTRIIKLGARFGDASEVALIELVDFNDNLLLADADKAAKTRRGRRGGKKAADETAVAPVAAAAGDDLTKIEGIGPKIAEVLSAAGISSFAALADATPEAIREILDNAGSQFNAHDPATWGQQAALANEGKWDELKKWQDELNGGRE
jgi:large subunit ribosomal protein L17